MVRTWCFHCGGPGSIPGWGIKIPQALQCGQKKRMLTGTGTHYFHCILLIEVVTGTT